jgi:hypothetical protein
MATLHSEDTECASTIALTASRRSAPLEDHGAETWQQLELSLKSGSRLLTEGAIICRDPRDEVAELANLLNDLLSGRRTEVRFEPAEPSFELKFERTREGGIKAEVWLDSGNATTGFYRWDAAGIRFYTTDEHLASFKQDLQQEFLAKSHKD